MAGDIDAEIKTLEQTVKAQPSNAGAHMALGVLYSLGGRIQESVQTANKEACLELGRALFVSGDADGAIAELEGAIKLDPKYIEAYFHLGLILERKGRIDAAITRYQEAVGIDEGFAPAWHRMGMCYSKKGMKDAAIDAIRKATGIESDFGVYHYDLGMLYLDTGRYDDAIGEFREAVRLDVYYPEAGQGMKIAMEKKQTTKP
jgi:tetratricopeptide (TPR) repeat protein